MQIAIISGRSGSGRSTAINVLEDIGYNCIDNLPVELLLPLLEQVQLHKREQPLAIGVDARNAAHNLLLLPQLIKTIRTLGHRCELLYLDASDNELLKRYSETRRKHPLSDSHTDLISAIRHEHSVLQPIREHADQLVDTTELTFHDLRDRIKKHFHSNSAEGMAIQFKSFGFKFGAPSDADLIYDARCLTNPHWQKELRPYTGKDQAVAEFLDKQDDVQEMLTDVSEWLTRWLPRYAANNRSYMTIAVGCTGGQHRSVYLCERLQNTFSKTYNNVQVRHRELNT